MFRHANQPVRGHGFACTLDAHHLRLTESRCAISQSRRGCAQHYAARRCDRVHALGHPDLLTNRGGTEGPRPNLTGNHLAGIEPYTQGEVDIVAISDLRSQQCTFLLDT